MGAQERIDTSSVGLTARLSEWVVGARYEDLPAGVVRLAKGSFLDTLGIELGGTIERAPKILCEYVKSQGGTRFASLIAQGTLTSAPNAALVNGTARLLAVVRGG